MAEEDLTFRKMRKQKKKRPAAWILLIVENLPRFLESHEEFESLISRLAQEGPSAGVYLIATSPTVGGIKFKLAASFNQTICLKLGDSSEYQQVLGRLEGLEPGDRQGSGLVKAKPPMLVQLAVPVLDETSPADSDRAGLEGVIANFWDKGSAPAIPQLPDNLTFDSHYAEPPDFKGTETVVGLSHLGVEPVLVDLDTAGHLMIAGGPRTGKTNLLANLCLGHARNNTPEQFQLVVVDPKLGSLGPLATLRHTRAYLESAEDFGSVLVQIAKDIKERRDSVKNSRGSKRAAIVAQFSKIVIVIDDFEAFTGDLTQTTRDLFEKLLRSGQGLGLHVIVAGAPGDLVGRGFDSYAKSIFSPRTGFLLGTREDDGAFGHARIGPSLWEMQTGDGYFLERGVVTEQLRTFNLQIDENGFEDRIREISEASEKAGHKRPTPFRVEKLPQSPNGPAGPKVDDEQLNDALAILNSLEA